MKMTSPVVGSKVATWLPWVLLILLTGMVLASGANRSFWHDEAMLGVAIRDTAWQEFPVLRFYDQSTPIVHGAVAKLLISAWGASDLPLRLLSFLVFLACVALSLRWTDGLAARLMLLFLIFGSPVLVRYSLEFKHYILEFAIGLLLCTAWGRRQEPAAAKAYAVMLLLSPLLTYSTVFLALALYIAAWVQPADKHGGYWKNGRWHWLHGAYLLAFALVYWCIIRPSTEFQFKNYIELYQAGMLSEHASQFKLWFRPFEMGTSVLGGTKFQLLLAMTVAAAVYVSFRAQQGSAVQRLLQGLMIAVVTYLMVLAASLAGKYSIQTIRHFLFLPAPLVWLGSYTLSLPSTKQHRWFLVFPMVAMLAGGLNHLRAEDYRQEAKPLLMGRQQVTFIYAAAQPVYEWYRGAHHAGLTAQGALNSSTAARLPTSSSAERLDEFQTTAGIWSIPPVLDRFDRLDAYLNWLMGRVTQQDTSTVLFTHFQIGQKNHLNRFRSLLPPRCASTIEAQAVGAVVLRVDCNNPS